MAALLRNLCELPLGQEPERSSVGSRASGRNTPPTRATRAAVVHNPKNLARMYQPGAQPLGHSPIPAIFRLADAPPQRTLGPMHTTTTTDAVTTPDILTQLRQAESEARLVMQRVQTKALETLQALMDEPEPTGDPKRDAFIARERNRRRLAATQALTHIRAVEREQRIAAKARARADKQTERSQKPESAPVPLAARPCRAAKRRATPRSHPRPRQTHPPASPPSTPSRVTSPNENRQWPKPATGRTPANDASDDEPTKGAIVGARRGRAQTVISTKTKNPAVGGVKAGDRTRTDNIQLGRLTLYH